MADAQHHWFVAPPLDGPITGGTLYNRFLTEALRQRGDQVSVVESPQHCEGFPWVDSLYLPSVAEQWSQRPMGLLAHYLPSVFAHREVLEPFETNALEHARSIVCTGSWMADTVQRLGAPPNTTCLVEPGVDEAARPCPAEPGVVTAVLAGTVTERKGVLALLEAIRTAPPASAWRLHVVGDCDADPAYAQACRGAAGGLPVRFSGALPPDEALRTIARAHLLVSAAHIESYGMAIAEAQTCGVPVLARRGGHVERLVARVPSGVVTRDIAELAHAFAAWVEDPVALDERRRISVEHRPVRRWSDAAREFRALAIRHAHTR